MTDSLPVCGWVYQNVTLKYSLPYINKSQKLGISYGISYATNKIKALPQAAISKSFIKVKISLENHLTPTFHLYTDLLFIQDIHSMSVTIESKFRIR